MLKSLNHLFVRDHFQASLLQAHLQEALKEALNRHKDLMSRQTKHKVEELNRDYCKNNSQD